MPAKTTQRIRYTGLVAIGTVAAFFLVLPRGGGDATIEIRMENGVVSFVPATARISKGDRILVVNRMRETHTATCRGCPWSSGDIQPGSGTFVTFEDRGDFRLFCRYHAEEGSPEAATVTVG